MKEKISTIVMIFLILLVSATTGAKGPEEVKAEWNYVICIVLRIVQFAAIGIATLVIILAGIKLMTSENLEERGGAKKMMIQVISGLIVIIIAVQLVNYIATGSRVEKFDLSACEDIFSTTTTIPVTTTTIPVTTTIVVTTTTTTVIGTTTTSSTTTTVIGTTTTSSTTTTIIPCANEACPNPEATCEGAQLLGNCEDIDGLPGLDTICGAGYRECCCTEYGFCC